MDYKEYIDKYHRIEKICSVTTAISLITSIICMIVVITYTIKGESAGIYSILGMISGMTLTISSSLLIKCSNALKLKNIVKNTDVNLDD